MKRCVMVRECALVQYDVCGDEGLVGRRTQTVSGVPMDLT